MPLSFKTIGTAILAFSGKSSKISNGDNATRNDKRRNPTMRKNNAEQQLENTSDSPDSSPRRSSKVFASFHIARYVGRQRMRRLARAKNEVSRQQAIEDAFLDATSMKCIQNSEERHKERRRSSRCRRGRQSALHDKPAASFISPMEQTVATHHQRISNNPAKKKQGTMAEKRYMSLSNDNDELFRRKTSMAGGSGLFFDASKFRVRREIKLNDETKRILNLPPEERTKQQLHFAMVSLGQVVKEFGEYPLHVQEGLVKYGHYESFEGRRVMIRQGHVPVNFYLVISGTAIASQFSTSDSKKGDVETVDIMRKGNAFGEMELMRGCKRSVTVTVREDMEILTVERRDFISIFMPRMIGSEPIHVKFLKSISCFKGWPFHLLANMDPKVCLFTYFRQGAVLSTETEESDWIYVVKNGSCRILKELDITAKKIKLKGINSSSTLRKYVYSKIRETHVDGSSNQKVTTENLKQGRSDRMRCDGVYPTIKKPVLPANKLIDETKPSQSDQASSNVPPGTKPGCGVHILLRTLYPGDVIGLESLFERPVDQPVKYSLVSDGAECILINKRFFTRHVKTDVSERIRHSLEPLPTMDSILRRMKDDIAWDVFKTNTVLGKC